MRTWTFFCLLAGLAACDDGPGPNDAGPRAEECNGYDDDGDGTIDTEPSGGPLRRDCSNACGIGREECEDGVWRYCSAPQPTDEICNGFDDDCDDLVDEVCDCQHGERRECGEAVGACPPGTEICTNGVWGECQLSFDPDDLHETCGDGVDNDCDGSTDEDCLCEPGTTQTCGTDEGECRAGVMTCEPDSTWGAACEGSVGPVTDYCDGLDNDCDGAVDLWAWSGFGWVADEQEPNDTCEQGSPLYNGSGMAELHSDGSTGWVSVGVDDPTNLMDYPSLYGLGDADWYYTRAVEDSHWCVPFTSDCTFVLDVELHLWDEDIVEGAVQDHRDYQVCVTTGSCSEAILPANQLCTHESDWNEGAHSYFLRVVWSGSCGGDDSRDVKIRVHSPTGAACGYYQLSVAFVYDTETACP